MGGGTFPHVTPSSYAPVYHSRKKTWTILILPSATNADHLLLTVNINHDKLGLTSILWYDQALWSMATTNRRIKLWDNIRARNLCVVHNLQWNTHCLFFKYCTPFLLILSLLRDIGFKIQNPSLFVYFFYISSSSLILFAFQNHFSDILGFTFSFEVKLARFLEV